MQYLHQVLVQDETLTVSTTRTDDLPVNPLSVILFTLKVLNDTGTLTDYAVYNTLMAQISKVEVLFQGSAVISGSLRDLAALGTVLVGRGPRQGNMDKTNNGTRFVTVPLLLGRRPFWPEECFPAVRRGELQLQTTVAAAQTGIDTPVLQVETVELLGATPRRFLKATTISKTPSATGDHDVDLPIGNKLAGVLLFGTTVPTAASYNASIGQVRLLVDNVEAYLARANWESLNGMLSLVAEGGHHNSEIFVQSDLAATYTQYQDSGLQQVTADLLENYAYINLDPARDDQFLLETRGRSRVHLRINADVADAIRVVPVELVDVGSVGGGSA